MFSSDQGLKCTYEGSCLGIMRAAGAARGTSPPPAPPSSPVQMTTPRIQQNSAPLGPYSRPMSMETALPKELTVGLCLGPYGGPGGGAAGAAHGTSPQLAPPSCLNLSTTSSQKFQAVPRRARIQGSETWVSLNSRLESNKEEDACATFLACPVDNSLNSASAGVPRSQETAPPLGPCTRPYGGPGGWGAVSYERGTLVLCAMRSVGS